MFLWLSCLTVTSEFGLVGFYGLSTIVGYLMSNTVYTDILNVYDLVWFRFYGISTIVGYSMPNPLYIYVYIYYFAWLGLWHINCCRLFNAKSSLYIYIRYIIFDLVGFNGISNLGMLFNAHVLFIHICIRYLICKNILSITF